MKLYNKYIFSKVALSLVAITSLLVILIWFSRTIVFIRYITENGVGLEQFLSLFILILPWLLLFIIPISIFISILIIYNNLLLNNEITTLKNAGLTKIHISKPALILSLFLTLFCFFISLYLMPLANKALREKRNNFENNYSNLSFNQGVFEKLKNLTIYVKKKDIDNNLFGILINQIKDSENSLTITAKSGRVRYENNNLLLDMNDGTIQQFNYKDNKEEILNFDKYVFNLTENNKTDYQNKKWKVQEMFVSELINPSENSSPKELMQYKAELQQRFTYPLMSLLLSMIALSIMLRGDLNRHGNIKNIITSSIVAVLFFATTITIFRLLDTSLNFIPLLYLHLFIFFAATLRILTRSKS